MHYALSAKSEHLLKHPLEKACFTLHEKFTERERNQKKKGKSMWWRARLKSFYMRSQYALLKLGPRHGISHLTESSNEIQLYENTGLISKLQLNKKQWATCKV